jgi:hypothetical protein
MTFPDARTVISTSTPANGNFAFQWRSDEPGIFTVSPFFPGSPALQPAIKNNRIEIQ